MLLFFPGVFLKFKLLLGDFSQIEMNKNALSLSLRLVRLKHVFNFWVYF